MASKTKAKPATAAPKTSKPTRQSFTPEQRAKILAEAKALKLTGAQVAKKHGISMVTYYLWRQKAGASRPKGKKSGRQIASLNGFSGDIHAVVQAKVREILPGIVQAEVARAVDAMLGGDGRKRR